MLEGQTGNPEVVIEAQRKYTLCLNALYEFSRLWISASLVHRLFEALQTGIKPFDSYRRRNSTSSVPGSTIPTEVNANVIRRLV